MSDSNSYRSSQDMDICKTQDPIEKLKPKLDDALRKNLEIKAEKVIEEAVEFALNSPEPEVKDLKKHMFTQELDHVIS